MRLTSRISRYISSLCISIMLLISVGSAAQTHKKINAERDTVPFLNGFAVSVDVAGAIQHALSDYGQYEASLRINLQDKYFPIIEIGYGMADHTDDAKKTNYKTAAIYGKVGIDFNLLKNKHDIYRLYGGVRYAHTSFDYDVSNPTITDPVWGGESLYGGKDIKANYHWIEAVIGVDVKIWKPIHLGWTARYRRRIAYNNGELGNVWYVPGYGIAGGTRLGGTFNISIDI